MTELDAAQCKCKNCGYHLNNGTNSYCDYCQWVLRHEGSLPESDYNSKTTSTIKKSSDIENSSGTFQLDDANNASDYYDEDYDEYNASDYCDAEDFYYDYYDDFSDFEEAEAYFNEHTAYK